MRALLPHPRAGLTLLELLVVIVIIAITTAVVPLAWRTPRATDPSALDGLTQTTRREAIRRGEALRLRVEADGAWVLATGDGADILKTGRIPAPMVFISLRVDALGTCRPGSEPANSERAGSGASFDMLACRYVTAAATAGMSP